jgi:hypothetical protein
MRTEFAPSYPVSIFVAGDYYFARRICQEFCDAVGLCVTVTESAYVYSGGEELGVIVGLINYPRFPKEPTQIEAAAIELGMRLREKLGQESFSVQTPTTTTWFSWRAADLAQAGEAGTAETVKQGSVHEHAVGNADAPKDK